MDALGYPMNGPVPQVLKEMDEADAVVYASQYLEIDKNGDPQQISEEQCMREVLKERLKPTSFGQEQPNSSPIVRSPHKPADGTSETSSNGYLSLGILYFYTASNHSYGFVGAAEWLIMPASRFTDAISLYASDVAWNNKAIDNYGAEVNTTCMLTIGQYDSKPQSSTTQYDYKSANRFPDGFYYTWTLPANTQAPNASGVRITYQNMSIQIAGKAQLKNNNINTFNVYLSYEHRQLHISPSASFGWTTGSLPGVSITGVLSAEKKHYGLSLKVE